MFASFWPPKKLNKEVKMHERLPIEFELKEEAKRISDKYNRAPVVIIVAGSKDAGIIRCMTASTLQERVDRLRDLLGILQTSIQIESTKHTFPNMFKRTEEDE